MACCTNFFVYKILLHAYYLPKNPSYFPDTPKFQIGLEIYRVIKCNSTIPICFLLRKYLLKKVFSSSLRREICTKSILSQWIPPTCQHFSRWVHTQHNLKITTFIGSFYMPLASSPLDKTVRTLKCEKSAIWTSQITEWLKSIGSTYLLPVEFPHTSLPAIKRKFCFIVKFFAFLLFGAFLEHCIPSRCILLAENLRNNNVTCG